MSQADTHLQDFARMAQLGQKPPDLSKVLEKGVHPYSRRRSGRSFAITLPWSGTRTSLLTTRDGHAAAYYDAKAPLKQIQYLLGHDNLDTTARYVNDEQKFGGEALSKLADIS